MISEPLRNPLSLFDVKDKVAIITGASGTFGRATALALTALGGKVLLASGSKSELDEVAGEVRELGGEPAVVVRRPDSQADAEAMLDSALATFGRVDQLVVASGFNKPGFIHELAYEDWQAVVATNLTGMFLCTQRAVRAMKQQAPRGGRIINNGSISADRPRPHSAPYTATKHAITGLTKSTILDGRPFDITASQVDIGNAATEMTQAISQGARQADGSLMAEPTFDARHVADAVVNMANLPLTANVQFMTIMAAKMPYIGRG